MHVLAISNSSEINLQSHAGRLKAEGLGVVGKIKISAFHSFDPGLKCWNRVSFKVE